MKRLVFLITALVAIIAAAGCLSPPQHQEFSGNGSGMVTLTCPEPAVTETVIRADANGTLSRLDFRSGDDHFYALLGAPARPVAGIVMSPGAGVKKESHTDRARWYADQGIAFLVIDVRGNGGETPGHPLDPEADFAAFRQGKTPQYYQSVCDMITARTYLSDRFRIPVIHAGDSNGGRYAALAAALDRGSAGYIGISTSGFHRMGDGYTGDARTFLLSIDPAVYIRAIEPRPVLIFHAEGDPVISSAEGRELFAEATGKKEFVGFNGTHGINSEVDREIVSRMLTFMGA